jgi:hypothetical protein
MQAIAQMEGRMLGKFAAIADMHYDQRLRALEELNIKNNLLSMSYTIQELVRFEEERRPAVWDWSQMGQEEASEAWQKILTWRREVFAVQWPTYFDRTTAACWPLHAQVRNELGSLCQLWEHVYHDSKSKPTTVNDFLHYWLPPAVARIADDLKQCQEAQEHRPLPEREDFRDDDQALIEQIVNADIGARPDIPKPQPKQKIEAPPLKKATLPPLPKATVNEYKNRTD